MALQRLEQPGSGLKGYFKDPAFFVGSFVTAKAAPNTKAPPQTTEFAQAVGQITVLKTALDIIYLELGYLQECDVSKPRPYNYMYLSPEDRDLYQDCKLNPDFYDTVLDGRPFFDDPVLKHDFDLQLSRYRLPQGNHPVHGCSHACYFIQQSLEHRFCVYKSMSSIKAASGVAIQCHFKLQHSLLTGDKIPDCRPQEEHKQVTNRGVGGCRTTTAGTQSGR